jgi:ribokinase
MDPQAPARAEELAHALLRLGPRHVVVTLGAEGALWVSRDRTAHFPALPVKVLDTVGAGDAFNAGLAVGLSEKLRFEDAVRLGITAASLSTEKRETIESYPCRDIVSRRMAEVLEDSDTMTGR